MRRLSLALLFVLAGVAAGLVDLGPDARHQRRRSRRAGRGAAARAARPRPPAPAVADRRPGLHPRRRADHRRRHQHRVAAGGAPPGVAVRQRSVLPVLLRRSPTRCSAAATATSRASARAWSISADGYVLTNSHVVGEGEVEVTVGLGDKRELRAKVIGVDASTDLALLKVEARGLPTIPWGDSSQLKVAEWVLAIGSPFQLNQTVTLGIVSALGRANVGHRRLRGLHPDRRRHQPGQLGRRAHQRARRAHRHQHRDLLAERRLPGHRLRRAEQPGAAGRRRPHQVRRGAARIDRLPRGLAAHLAAGRRAARADDRRAWW